MSSLNDIIRHMLEQFGRPQTIGEIQATDDNVTNIDERLFSVEERQREIDARLRRLEIQSWRD